MGSRRGLDDDERHKIQILYFEDKQSAAAVARILGRHEDTIRKFIAQHKPLPLAARASLQAGQLDAAKAWKDAMPVAAGRGDHKPAKDLLLHTGVIDPLGETGTGSQLVVIVGMPGQPALAPPTQEQIENVKAARAKLIGAGTTNASSGSTT